jgi:imidazole glycerol-phosphate synthase subunit HisH
LLPIKGQSLGVVDYGTGNLRSVVKAFEHLGADVHILQKPDKLSNMDALIFPGQGTFDQCMEALERTGFSQTIKEWILCEKPFLGICLGLQVLFEKSEEGEKEGLGLFPGFVKKFSLGRGYKIPHMGWNSVDWGELKNDPIHAGLEEGDQFYFVHSYHVVSKDDTLRTLTTSYGYPFISGIFHNNCFATQFHPEKSQAKGLQIYRNFLEKVVA